MAPLLTFHGHIVDLRRYVNVHLYHLRPLAPTDRYELWVRAFSGEEKKFIIHTREMPARRGHEVSLVMDTRSASQVLAIANWTTVDGINYARTEPAALLHRSDALASMAVLGAMVGSMGWPGVGFFIPAIAVLLSAAAIVRLIGRARLAAVVDHMIDIESWRTTRRPFLRC